MGLFNRGQRQPDKAQTDGATQADETPTVHTPADELPPAEELAATEASEAPEPVAEAPEPVAEVQADAPVAQETAEPVSEPSEGVEPSAEPQPHADSEPQADSEPHDVPEPPDAEIKVERVEPPLDPDTIVADPDAGRIEASQAIAPKRTPGVIRSEAADAGEGRHAKVISFANQKGGVAKTTTTLNLAVALKELGHRVLAIDLDPQGNLTMSQGIDPDKVEKSMFDVLVHKMPIAEIVLEREIDLAVGSIDLAGAEIAMSTQIGRERSLEKAINEVGNDYDFICIDTPPSLGLLTVNALTASDRVIVPVQCEYLSMRGLVQLQNTLGMIRENLNPGVEIEGILPTMLDARTVHAKEAIEILEENFGDLVFKSRIRKAIKFAEAPVRGASVLKYDPNGNAAEQYRDLAREVLAKEVVTHGTA
jgi:chromosome partitioning protein